MEILTLLSVVVVILVAIYYLEPTFDYIQIGPNNRQAILWYNGFKGRNFLLLWKYKCT